MGKLPVISIGIVSVDPQSKVVLRISEKLEFGICEDVKEGSKGDERRFGLLGCEETKIKGLTSDEGLEEEEKVNSVEGQIEELDEELEEDDVVYLLNELDEELDKELDEELEEDDVVYLLNELDEELDEELDDELEEENTEYERFLADLDKELNGNP